MVRNLQLSVLMLLVHVSQAVWQYMTVKKGDTVTFNCPITNAHLNQVEWRNPEDFTMFFSHKRALKDKRYGIVKLSKTEFIVSISNVTFKDGGNFTCYQYGHPPTERKVELTVLGHPRMQVAKHERRTVIKCTAEGTHSPPEIYWKFDDGPETLAHAHVIHEGKKYTSEATINVQPVKNRTTVKCLVRHPALYSQPLMNFVKIGRNYTKSRRTTTSTSPTARPQRSTDVPITTTTSWARHGRTTVHQATTDVNGPSSETTLKLSTVHSNEPKTATAFPLNPVTSTPSHLNSIDDSGTSASSGSTRRNNDTSTNATSTTGWISVSETTEEITPHNHTEGNSTGSFNDPITRTGSRGSSSVLVFLVTSLIFCLLVVVIFFAIKLRRAHILWRRENEESDPSEESSKSKSSQEERNVQGQRRRGLFNTAFTQYVVEKPAVITSVINTAAMEAGEGVEKEQPSQPQALGQAAAKCDIKETEL